MVSDPTSYAAIAIWTDLYASLAITLRDKMPGIVSLILKQLLPGWMILPGL